MPFAEKEEGVLKNKKCVDAILEHPLGLFHFFEKCTHISDVFFSKLIK